MGNIVSIIDYGSGNLHSIGKAVLKVATPLDFEVIITESIDKIKDSSHVILPGVGAFGDCMEGLSRIEGMIGVLNEHAITSKKPFLGICVGMQLLADYGMEYGQHKGLGWIGGEVIPIRSDNKDIKIPHMGWNELFFPKKHPLFEGIEEGQHTYFVHSYHMSCNNPEDIIAKTEYGLEITAAVAKDNIYGVQFHPEKSQDVGMKVLENFLKI